MLGGRPLCGLICEGEDEDLLQVLGDWSPGVVWDQVIGTVVGHLVQPTILGGMEVVLRSTEF